MAPQKFHDWLANLFVSLGFRQMGGHPAYFRHDEKDVEIVIHIDDGIIAGPPAQMAETKQILQGKVSMKDMGSIDKHGKKHLGKIIKRTARGFTVQADPEFYDGLLEETGLDQGVSSPTPGTNAMKHTAEWEKRRPGTRIWTETVASTIGILIFKHISQFWSFGKCVNTLCVPEHGSTYARASIGGS